MNGFNLALELTLDVAFKQASEEKRHQFFTVEHLTLALLENEDVAAMLKNLPRVDLDLLRKNLLGIVNRTPLIPSADKDKKTEPTISVQRVLQRAVFRVKSANRIEINGLDVLDSIFEEKVSKSVDFLREAGINRSDIQDYMHRRMKPVKEPVGTIAYKIAERIELPLSSEAESDQYLINLNDKARAGLLELTIGRESEILQTIQILIRKQKNNPLLIGEPGVGKTAIVEGLAQRIVKRQVPQQLSDSTIYALNLTALLAGTQYRGEFEKRVQDILREIRADPGSILFIDEIHTIIGAGAVSGSVVDLSNLLKPILTTGEFKCIGATTYQEYHHVFEKDAAIARRFQKIDVPEPTQQQTVQILQGLKERFEKHYGVRYSDDALKSAVELTVHYLHDRFLPDKAIDVMDEAGAADALLPPSKRTGVIDVKAIEKVVSKIAHIPEISISQAEQFLLKSLAEDLKAVIYGQDQAIDLVADAIKLASSGLREADKPIGAFLFAGPTGVGKTELARQLSRLMGIHLLRYDMSEYQEAHTVSRLIGAPPGYVGYEKGGLLTDEVNKYPHCVLLLDEIEKAHPDIYNLLLQIMDYGLLTDSTGRKTDFRHVIIIMTTNVGSEAISRPVIGFTTEEHLDEGILELNRVFSPEFRNRLDAIVQFRPLDVTTIANVVNKLIRELTDQLQQKNIVLEVDETARLWLAEHGYDQYMGARPMKRLIQAQLKKQLADELLFGRLVNGGKVSVKAEKEGLTLQIEQ
jgi:ATP-dependent Clp protease ATP-binding subunit ClpA